MADLDIYTDQEIMDLKSTLVDSVALAEESASEAEDTYSTTSDDEDTEALLASLTSSDDDLDILSDELQPPREVKHIDLPSTTSPANGTSVIAHQGVAAVHHELQSNFANAVFKWVVACLDARWHHKDASRVYFRNLYSRQRRTTTRPSHPARRLRKPRLETINPVKVKERTFRQKHARHTQGGYIQSREMATVSRQGTLRESLERDRSYLFNAQEKLKCMLKELGLGPVVFWKFRGMLSELRLEIWKYMPRRAGKSPAGKVTYVDAEVRKLTKDL